MKSNAVAKGVYKGFMLIGLTLLGLYLIYVIRSVFAYLLLAIVFALIGRPIVRFLIFRFKFPKILAVSLTVFLLFTLLIGLVWLFVPLITEQGEKLALLDLKSMQNELEIFSGEITNSTGASKEIIEDLVEEVDIEESVKEQIETGVVSRLFNSVLGVISEMGIGLLSVLFITFFLLKDTYIIQNTMVQMFHKSQKSKIIKSIDAIKILLSRYFIGLLLQILVLFVIYASILAWVDLDNYLAIAFLCALFNIIPYAGPVIGAIFMIVFTVTNNIGMDLSSEIMPKIIIVLIGVTIGQLIDNFFSQPYIFSNSVKSHPLEIFLIIIIAGLTFGVVGMIVAIPSYTVLKVILREFAPNNRIVKALTTQF